MLRGGSDVSQSCNRGSVGLILNLMPFTRVTTGSARWSLIFEPHVVRENYRLLDTTLQVACTFEPCEAFEVFPLSNAY